MTGVWCSILRTTQQWQRTSRYMTWQDMMAGRLYPRYISPGVIGDRAISQQYSAPAIKFQVKPCRSRFRPDGYKKWNISLSLSMKFQRQGGAYITHRFPRLSLDTGVSQPPPAQIKILDLSLIPPPHPHTYTHTTVHPTNETHAFPTGVSVRVSWLFFLSELEL